MVLNHQSSPQKGAENAKDSRRAVTIVLACPAWFYAKTGAQRVKRAVLVIVIGFVSRREKREQGIDPH